jgi:hypothetical protein
MPHVAASKEALTAYLTDHRAGAAAGGELAGRLRDKHRGTAEAPFFSGLAKAIDEDRATLDGLIEQLGLARSRVKETAGWMLERVSRLKLNDRLTGSPQLTTLLQEEALSLGIEGKLALWKSLKAVADDEPALAATNFDELVERAQEQLDGLETRRLAAATNALRA